MALCAFALAGPAAAGGTLSPERRAELANLLRHDCGACHGLTRKGGLGPSLEPHRLAGRSPGQIAEVILDGVPGTPMPPWGRLLSRADAQWLAHELKQGHTGEGSHYADE